MKHFHVLLILCVQFLIIQSVFSEESNCGGVCTTDSDCGSAIGLDCHCHASQCFCETCTNGAPIESEPKSTFHTTIRFLNETVQSFDSIKQESIDALATLINSAPIDHDDEHIHAEEHNEDEEIIHAEDILIVSVTSGSAIVTFEYQLPSDEANEIIEHLDHEITDGEYSTLLNLPKSSIELMNGGTQEIVDETESRCNSSCQSWKIGFLFIVLFEAILFGLIPMSFPTFSEKFPSFQSFVNLLEVYSGGILLGTALLHVLPHAMEELLSKELTEWNEFPYVLTMFGIGFLMVFGVESLLAVFVLEKLNARKKKAAAISEVDCEQGCETQDEVLKKSSSESVSEQVILAVELNDERVLDDVEEIEKVKKWKKGRENIRGVFDAAVCTLALSMHAIFAGVSLGIGDWDQALALFIAIASHKWNAALVIGVQLVESEVSKLTHIIWITMFALVTPIGIVIGLVSSNTASSLAIGTLQALASGMLIYVSTLGTVGTKQISEVANLTWKSRWMKYLAYVAGFATMVLITVIMVFTNVHADAH
eukprot:CAMPEP_0182444456 /NCGR_PEP_ID=MMETSP1172-20130603/2901_1 /TAXON_ID=708627 /ORGANISM="Timspurckia oligopyrenoides, Strain CCMP3278" /LENGTH=537 /DNA_ID=CAMNT_0024640013 /DNA_START=81 /DNA_END=1694 /DNA_ORIENTATION=-